MNYKTLQLEILGQTAEILINRPEAMNALNSQVFRDINAALDEIENNKNCCAVIITGNGKAFVAGADIAEMSEMGKPEATVFSSTGQDTFNRLANFKIPIIAAINGFALGGGCELAMGCDIRIASTFAKFGQPEVNLGLIPGYFGMKRLASIVGLSNALYLLCTADMIDANEALRLGLVQKVTEPEELLNEARKMASKIASKGKNAVAKVKEITVKGSDMNLSESRTMEIEAFASLFGTPESKEGMTAFLEKRKPNW
jgi:enoyl-CoA hydratase